MALDDTYYLGSTIDDIETLEELGIDYDPDASYLPFSVVDTLGDLSEDGNGFEQVTWHFAAMAPGDADILYDFLDGNISAHVVLRSRLNRLNMDKTNYQFKTWEGEMSWMKGEEQNPALHTADVTITFKGLQVIPSYP